MTKSSRSPPPPAAAGEGNGKKAVKKWVGWEEEVMLNINGSRVVLYYLRCAPPLDGDGVVERHKAVIGKFWGVGNMEYTAHPEFLRSIDAAAAGSPGPSRAVAVAVQATQLRWKSRREVMDRLTSLVEDSPYSTSGPADTSDGCALGDHDGGSLAPKDALSAFAGKNDGGSTSTASKDAPLAFAGNNPEGFAWLGPLPHLDKWRKHYRSFRRDGIRISVHDFIYIKSDEGNESNVGYVEDMYEDGGGNNMVLARWLDKPSDDHGVKIPSDVHDREVFFTYGLQDIGVNWVGGLAPVLNYQHFEWFQRRGEEHSKWKPYLCHRQIVGPTLEPFNIAQLQGYANQEIVRALFIRAPSSMAMVVHSKEANKDKSDGGQKRKHKEISEDKTVKSPAAPGNVTSDRAVKTHTALTVINTVQKVPQCNATSGQTIAKGAPEHVASNNQTLKKLPPCNATNAQTVQTKLPQRSATNAQTVQTKLPQRNATNAQTVQAKLPPCNATNGQTVQAKLPQRSATNAQTVQTKLPPCNATNGQTVQTKLPPCNATNGQTVQTKLPPCNATNGQTVQKLPPYNATNGQTAQQRLPPQNAAHSQAVVKLRPSGDSASGSRSRESVVKPNAVELFIPGSRVEALSQDSGIKGCWFRCQVVKRKRKGDLVKLKYLDIPNADGTGHLREWLRLQRGADPDTLGIRLTGRPMIRPWPSNLPKIPSPMTPGTVVDAWLKGGWWEGIVIEPDTVGRIRVYLPGERTIEQCLEGNLRRSFEWVGDKWLNLMPRKDVASRLPPHDVLINQILQDQEMPKAASLLSSLGGARQAIPAGPKIILQRTNGEPSAKPMPPVPTILEELPLDEFFSKPAAQNTSSKQPSKKAEGVSAELAAPRPRLQPREKVEGGPAKPAPQKAILHCSSQELRLQYGKKGPAADEPAKPAAEKPMPPAPTILEELPLDEFFSKPAAQNTSSQQSRKKAEGVSAELAAPRPRLQSRERVGEEPAKPAPQKTILQCSSEGLTLQFGKKAPAGDPAKPAADKVSLRYCQEGNGMFSADGAPPDSKRPRVDLTDVLKSGNVLKWAERKARGSGPLMGYSDSSSQEGTSNSASNGNTALVPVKEGRRTNEDASVSTAAPMI